MENINTMAKNIGLLLCFFLLHLSVGSVGNNSVRDCLVGCAKDEIGVKEKTGNNDGKRVEQYLRHTGLPKGFPWCAACQSFIYSKCGVQNPNSAYCPDWFKASKVIYQRGLKGKDKFEGERGDVFGIWFQEKNRIAHMGMIESVEGNLVVTLEGNTGGDGGRDGDGFYRKYRLKNQIFTVANYTR